MQLGRHNRGLFCEFFAAFHCFLFRELQKACLYFNPICTSYYWERNTLRRRLCFSVLSLALLRRHISPSMICL